ncbi:NKG2-A/NKG2-B type II integral membrane protein-like [Peromyscus eremicus]|uniref:NKG2-A/NKG2-B type II integral membrane protein-like n=1 Tax=Peromyscus eremicus TaxID=42410 RepID=UPI0027DC6FCB|nr:NKG2-A/NKG2-B type II integral membrane protein-like [Peromyscus eremicus]
MSNEGVTYAELNVVKDSRNQKRKPRDTRSSISVTEQEITYAEFSFQNVPQERLPICRDCCCKGFPSPPEKLITGILGIIGFALMVAVVIITTVATPHSEAKAQINSSLTRTQKDNNLSSSHPCDHCPKEWISYSHKCYYIGVEKKTWNDSSVSCTSKNSTLPYIDSEEEKVFLQSLSWVSWTGVFRKSRDQLWVWKKDSTFKPKMKEFSSVEGNCVMLSASGLTTDDCTALHTYLCERNFNN